MSQAHNGPAQTAFPTYFHIGGPELVAGDVLFSKHFSVLRWDGVLQEPSSTKVEDFAFPDSTKLTITRDEVPSDVGPTGYQALGAGGWVAGDNEISWHLMNPGRYSKVPQASENMRCTPLNYKADELGTGSRNIGSFMLPNGAGLSSSTNIYGHHPTSKTLYYNQEKVKIPPGVFTATVDNEEIARIDTISGWEAEGVISAAFVLEGDPERVRVIMLHHLSVYWNAGMAFKGCTLKASTFFIDWETANPPDVPPVTTVIVTSSLDDWLSGQKFGPVYQAFYFSPDATKAIGLCEVGDPNATNDQALSVGEITFGSNPFSATFATSEPGMVDVKGSEQLSGTNCITTTVLAVDYTVAGVKTTVKHEYRYNNSAPSVPQEVRNDAGPQPLFRSGYVGDTKVCEGGEGIFSVKNQVWWDDQGGTWQPQYSYSRTGTCYDSSSRILLDGVVISQLSHDYTRTNYTEQIYSQGYQGATLGFVSAGTWGAVCDPSLMTGLPSAATYPSTSAEMIAAPQGWYKTLYHTGIMEPCGIPFTSYIYTYIYKYAHTASTTTTTTPYAGTILSDIRISGDLRRNILAVSTIHCPRHDDTANSRVLTHRLWVDSALKFSETTNAYSGSGIFSAEFATDRDRRQIYSSVLFMANFTQMRLLNYKVVMRWNTTLDPLAPFWELATPTSFTGVTTLSYFTNPRFMLEE